MTTLALITAIAATGHDDDLPPLIAACARAGLPTRALAWDDASVGWQRLDAALLRSPWDYTLRLPEFLAWCERTAQHVPLFNPVPVIRWNTDKHYLRDLDQAGVPVVPTRFVEPDEEPLEVLRDFLSDTAIDEFVVKPAVSAGSRDTQRYLRDQEFAAGNHIARLLDENRSVMLQPYLASVDSAGETALVFFDGVFSHALRKAAQLRRDEAPAAEPFASHGVGATTATPEELALAERVLLATQRLLKLDAPLLYARVDLLRDPDGPPRLLELELTEPSLFFEHAPEAADRLVQAVLARLPNATVRARMDPA